MPNEKPATWKMLGDLVLALGLVEDALEQPMDGEAAQLAISSVNEDIASFAVRARDRSASRERNARSMG